VREFIFLSPPTRAKTQRVGEPALWFCLPFAPAAAGWFPANAARRGAVPRCGSAACVRAPSARPARERARANRGDIGRYREIWGDIWRYREILRARAGRLRRVRRHGLRGVLRSGALRALRALLLPRLRRAAVRLLRRRLLRGRRRLRHVCAVRRGERLPEVLRDGAVRRVRPDAVPGVLRLQA